MSTWLDEFDREIYQRRDNPLSWSEVASGSMDSYYEEQYEDSLENDGEYHTGTLFESTNTEVHVLKDTRTGALMKVTGSVTEIVSDDSITGSQSSRYTTPYEVSPASSGDIAAFRAAGIMRGDNHKKRHQKQRNRRARG